MMVKPTARLRQILTLLIMGGIGLLWGQAALAKHAFEVTINKPDGSNYQVVRLNEANDAHTKTRVLTAHNDHSKPTPPAPKVTQANTKANAIPSAPSKQAQPKAPAAPTIEKVQASTSENVAAPAPTKSHAVEVASTNTQTASAKPVTTNKTPTPPKANKAAQANHPLIQFYRNLYHIGWLFEGRYSSAHHAYAIVNPRCAKDKELLKASQAYIKNKSLAMRWVVVDCPCDLPLKTCGETFLTRYDFSESPILMYVDQKHRLHVAQGIHQAKDLQKHIAKMSRFAHHKAPSYSERTLNPCMTAKTLHHTERLMRHGASCRLSDIS